MNDSLFSVRNELTADDDNRVYLELNPAVVASESGAKYALSAVCLGPALEADRHGLSLEVSCDGERAVLQAVHQQSEPTETQDWLTVALFSVSRSFLEILAAGRHVEIGLGNGVMRLSRGLDAENRSNVGRFLDLARQRCEPISAPAAGLAAGAPA